MEIRARSKSQDGDSEHTKNAKDNLDMVSLPRFTCFLHRCHAIYTY